ncbi:MAG: hypothetical protein ABII96_02485 [Candidatus Zixiibacteriota bacterium]
MASNFLNSFPFDFINIFYLYFCKVAHVGSKGGNTSPPFCLFIPVNDGAKGGAAVQSRTVHAKQSIGTLAPDGGEEF